MLQILDMTSYREGNIIDLGFTRQKVWDACSSPGYLLSLISLECLFVYNHRAPFWERALIVLSAVPLTILTNSMRIASIGVFYRFFGIRVAGRFIHVYAGWLFFVAGISILILEMWALSRFFSEKESFRAKDKPLGLKPLSSSESHFGEGSGGLFRPSQSVIVIFLLGVTLLVSQKVDFREKVPKPIRTSRAFIRNYGDRQLTYNLVPPEGADAQLHV